MDDNEKKIEFRLVDDTAAKRIANLSLKWWVKFLILYVLLMMIISLINL